MSRMLYRKGNKLLVDGNLFDYLVVEESQAEKELENGWFYTTQEALEGKQKSAIIKGDLKEEKPKRKRKKKAE